MLEFKKMEIDGYPDYRLSFDEVGNPRIWSDKMFHGNVVGWLGCNTVSNYGYIQLYLRNELGNPRPLLLHRIIATACLPNPENLPCVDHINGNKLDNRVNNLRWVSKSDNNHNQKAAKGYCWHKQHNKWYAQININGKVTFLGLFTNEADARTAYLSASAIHFPGVKPEAADHPQPA
jgi:hypothetical protein